MWELFINDAHYGAPLTEHTRRVIFKYFSSLVVNLQ